MHIVLTCDAFMCPRDGKVIGVTIFWLGCTWRWWCGCTISLVLEGGDSSCICARFGLLWGIGQGQQEVRKVQQYKSLARSCAGPMVVKTKMRKEREWKWSSKFQGCKIPCFEIIQMRGLYADLVEWCQQQEFYEWGKWWQAWTGWCWVGTYLMWAYICLSIYI